MITRCTTGPEGRREAISRAYMLARNELQRNDCALSDGLRAAGLLCTDLCQGLREAAGAGNLNDQEAENAARVALQMLETLKEALMRGRDADLPLMLQACADLLFFLARDGDQVSGIPDPFEPALGGG